MITPEEMQRITAQVGESVHRIRKLVRFCVKIHRTEYQVTVEENLKIGVEIHLPSGQ